MHESVWQGSAALPEFAPLTGTKKCDVLIIGGGLCGLLCAYHLQKAGVDYILAEGNRIALGVTKNTTAKITYQHGLIYSKLFKNLGPDIAARYLEANRRAFEKYEELCRDIDCDFEYRDSYVYSLNDLKKIENEVDAARRLGLGARLVMETELPFDVAGAVRFPRQAQFNPIKFIATIAKDLNIYEHTFITETAPGRAGFRDGEILANKIIVATHFPFINKHGAYYMKLYQHRSYVAALEGAPTIKGMYVDEADNGLSFRSYKNMLLLGGGGHRTGKKGGNWQELYAFAKKHYPAARVKYSWATQDCMSLDGAPYIGQYSGSTNDLYVASGFNKWGMTTSMAAAEILSDMVTGRKNPCAKAFLPQRRMLRPQLLMNAAESTVNLLTPTAPRCPHLGCALKWNSAEHSWDCPCHGSRFEEDGELITGPATGWAKV